jgi:hypothetical protein
MSIAADTELKALTRYQGIWHTFMKVSEAELSDPESQKQRVPILSVELG